MENNDKPLKLFENENNNINEFEIIKNIFISSGPWLISIISLLFIKFMMKDIISKDLYDLFMATIIYTFIFSMIITSPFTNMINRYIGDKVYNKDYKDIMPTFISSLILVGSTAYICAFIYINQFTNLQEHQFSIAQLFTSVSVLWLVMIFIAILKNYTIINLSFIAGMGLSIVLLFNYFHNSLEELIMAFTSGILLTIALLVAKLKYDFKVTKLFNFEFLKKIKYYPFFLSGLFLYLALWIDKFIYWYTDYGVEVTKGFYFFPEYDFVVFVAYLALIPTTSYLNVYINEVFFQEQKNYFKAIENKKTFAVINNYSKNILNSFYRGIFKISISQIVISIIFVFLVQYTFDKLQLNITTLPLLRIVVFAISLQMILVSIIMFLYYFDFQKEILFITIFYFVLNLVITLFMADLSYDFVGYSYFLSALFTLVVAFLIATYKMERINFYIIAKNEV